MKPTCDTHVHTNILLYGHTQREPLSPPALAVAGWRAACLQTAGENHEQSCRYSVYRRELACSQWQHNNKTAMRNEKASIESTFKD